MAGWQAFQEGEKNAFKLMEIPYSSGGILYTLRSASNFAAMLKKQQYYPHTPSHLVLFSTSCLVESSFEVFILMYSYLASPPTILHTQSVTAECDLSNFSAGDREM